ncbi:MAG: hypothetical protein WBF79_11945 [Rhodococcus sp. (in: high G+C Gram-positive bacteria)]
MTRSDVLTVGTARSIGTETPIASRWTCDDETYWGTSTTTPSVSSGVTGDRTTLRRSPAPRDSRRPHAGAVDYRRRSTGVSRVEHAPRRRHGFASMVAVSLITAVSALGLVGLANMRAVEAPSQPSVSQQVELGAVAGR